MEYFIEQKWVKCKKATTNHNKMLMTAADQNKNKTKIID